MICPVCKRDLAPTLSICLTCGAMINDTVREELETKISRTAEPLRLPSGELRMKPKSPVPPPQVDTPKPLPPVSTAPAPTPTPTPAPAKAMGTRFSTADLRAKKTSPTLVEFQTKKATVPEWRLQLQNSVRQKVGSNRRDEATPNPGETGPSKPRSTNGANALKVEFVEEENEPARHQNPRVASALKRIEESRRTFSNQPVAEQSVQVGGAPQQPAPRNFPFNVVAKANDVSKPANQKATINPSPKPILVSPLKIEKKGFDTNKLPRLESKSATVSRSFIPAAQSTGDQPALFVDEKALQSESIEVETEADEIDDLAPFSMRFSAGLFDMIIGFFATMILLSPFFISGGAWFSVSGLLAITAALAIVTFLYLTVSIAFAGRTFGMRLFSLELVDVEENAYPTMHQAAVSSAVFLLSLMFAGIGFLPMFFNEERRAAHDILSGTILVREY